MRGENLRYQSLEFFHHGVGDGRALFLGQRFLQRAALVHGGGSDDATIVRNSLEPLEFAGVSFMEALQMNTVDELSTTCNFKLKAGFGPQTLDSCL